MIFEKVDDNCKRFPLKTAIYYNKTTITYGQMQEEVGRYQSIIRKLPLASWDQVGLVFDNIPPYIYWILALFSYKQIIALIPSYFKKNEIEYHLKNLDLKICIVQNKYISLYSRFTVIYEDAIWSVLLISDGTESDITVMNGDCMIQFTSGSQGESKAVVRSEDSIIHEISTLRKPFEPRNEDSVFAPFSPIFHSYGLVGGTLFPLYHGNSIFLADVRYPKYMLSKLENIGVSHIFATPFLYDSFCSILTSGENRIDFSKISKCFSAGAALDSKIAKKFNDLTGIDIFQNYGSTEMGTMAIGDLPIYMCDSLGTFLGEIEYKILPLEFLNKKDCGELLIKNDNMGFRYLYPKGIEREKNYQNFYRTGDIVLYSRGGLKYLGRYDGLINVNGLKVYLNEIKNTLQRMDSIKDVAVDTSFDKNESYICAYVVLKDGEMVTENEVKQFCKQQMADYKIPRKVFFVKELPHNLSGKILKKYLKEGS